MFRIPKIAFILIIILLHFSFTQESYIDSTQIRDPHLAWKLGAIPGAGQFYNGKWVKGTLLAGAQIYVTSQFKNYRQNGPIGQRNTYAWWVIGLWVYSMLDAYVDAQLSTFPQKVEIPAEVENTAPVPDTNSIPENRGP